MTQRQLPAQTKTSVPARRPAAIRRPRLLDLLREALPKRLSLVTAPSGFGKTTLLFDFVDELTRPVSWLTLDRWANAPRELLAGLAEALQPDTPVDIDVATDLDALRRQLRLVLWSGQRRNEPRVLVLDDFQAIEGSKEAVGLIEDLLVSAPENWHVIISSRGLPGLRGLARLAAQGQVLCLGIDDLSFDHEEIARFFAEVRGTQITDERAADVLKQTDGWATSVALLSATAAGDVESAATRELFLDDLLEEAFQDQTAAVRRFLSSTSVLPFLEPGLCDQLLDQTNSGQMLKQLERKCLFVTRVGSEPLAYRVHEYFRRFLMDRLRAERVSTLSALSRKAGNLFVAARKWDEAFSCFVEARLWADADHALREAADELLSFGRAATLGDWLELLPSAIVDQKPDLGLVRARVHLDLGRPDDALKVIAALLDQECPELLRGKLLLYRGMALSRKGQHREAVRTGRTAVAVLGRIRAPQRVRAEAYLRLGTAIGAAGQFARAVAPLKRALAIAEVLGDLLTASIAADALGEVLATLGQIAEAKWYFERARQGWASLGNDYRLALTLNNLGVMYCWQGEYDVSWELLSEAADRSRLTKNARMEAFATLSLGDVKRDTVDYHEALALYEDGLEKARRIGEASLVDYAVDAIGTTYMLLGDLKKAEVLIKHAAAEVDERGGVYQSGLVVLSLGVLDHLKGEFGGSADRLQTAVRLLKEAGAARDEARAHFHLAHVHLATNSRRRALAALQEVARLAKEIGYSEFLIVEARRCPALTGFAASKGIGDGLFARLREDDSRRLARAGKVRSKAGLKAVAAYPPVHALALGETIVRLDGKAITDPEWSSLKSKEMFFYFLCSQEARSRDECCAALWPEFDQARATSNFHSTLYRVRSATYFDIVANASGHYRINPQARLSFDVREFEEMVQDADARTPGDVQRTRSLERAADLYSGPFAREFYSEWAETFRRHLEDKYLRVLANLAGQALGEQAHERCIEFCDRILAVDECNDEAYSLKIESCLALGDRVSARRHFESFKRLLLEEGSALDSGPLAEIGRKIAAAKA